MISATLVMASTLYFGQKSWHWNKVDIKRESHALVIYERQGWYGGYWRNSYDKHTFAVGRRLLWDTFHSGAVEAGVKAAIVTGYQYPIMGAVYCKYKGFVINMVPGEVVGVGMYINW